MIPGRTNRPALQATQAGVSRGQCAEYYGGAHALMSFQAVARERHEYDEWLRAESRPAVRTDGEGAKLFVASGCGACHRIRGLASAAGSIGSDLSPTSRATAFADWIRNNLHIKPGNRMPTDGELRVLWDYLDELE